MTEKDPLDLVGQVVAEKYRIERFVHQGGFAAVYRASHTIWHKPVAIKFFNALSAAAVDQRAELHQSFIREGALLTELSSQSAAIVQARDVGTHVTQGGQWLPFMVLEWLEGSALDELIDREQKAGYSPWSLGEVCALVAQVAAALDVAHRRGVAHRDIKPANLVVLSDDARTGGVAVKVLDFGVAKIMADSAELQAALARTGVGATSFTPQYGAPEQFTRSFGATGPWTDVYALALVASELLSFRAPFEGDDVVQLGFATANPDRRPTPRRLGAQISDAVENVFSKALAVSPRDRHASAGEFLSELSQAAGVIGVVPTLSAGAARASIAQISSGTPPAVSKSPEPARRHNFVPALLLGTLALGAGGFVAFGKLAPAKIPAYATRASPPAPPASVMPPQPICPERTAEIKAGQYFRGTDAKDAPDNQKPAHNVTLAAYCIDLYEVTAGEYKACADVGKCKRAGSEVEWPKITPAERRLYSSLCTFGEEGKDDYPINCVSFSMADTFCKAQGKRLPTEAEWEYATRGPDGRVYPWGDEEPTFKHLNACGAECAAWGRKNKTELAQLYPENDGYATLAPVGRFEAGRSRFGPYDVVGNVWEWVSDWYGDYTPEEKKNPTGPGEGERRVIRGGGWNGSYPSWLHPTFRYAQDPSAQSHGIGFRCAKTLAP